MLARVAREIRDLHKNPPEGVRLIVDPETGCPDNLGEIMVRILDESDDSHSNLFQSFEKIQSHLRCQLTHFDSFAIQIG